ncbi:hypothetical protein MTR67_017898 [Solanum verrucosum]|uniref:Uncharacterized protein n=1 Tax=Solanum verrucosum TaxID=315347 RepID=A0AAF0QLE8_SOLVR|nr:hypothetical protein MTR67_017898 [Solanum verrucosum]
MFLTLPRDFMAKTNEKDSLERDVVDTHLTRELCIEAYLLSKSVVRIGWKSGRLQCALYLKQCVSSLQNGSVKLFLSFPTRKPPKLLFKKSWLKQGGTDQGMEKPLDE